MSRQLDRLPRFETPPGTAQDFGAELVKELARVPDFAAQALADAAELGIGGPVDLSISEPARPGGTLEPAETSPSELAAPDLDELANDPRELAVIAHELIRSHDRRIALDVASRLAALASQRRGRGWRLRHQRHAMLAAVLLAMVVQRDAAAVARREETSREE